jgi:hypothetical protein
LISKELPSDSWTRLCPLVSRTADTVPSTTPLVGITALTEPNLADSPSRTLPAATTSGAEGIVEVVCEVALPEPSPTDATRNSCWVEQAVNAMQAANSHADE